MTRRFSVPAPPETLGAGPRIPRHQHRSCHIRTRWGWRRGTTAPETEGSRHHRSFAGPSAATHCAERTRDALAARCATRRKRADESACKPDSVPGRRTAPGRQPSISTCRCRQARAVYPRTSGGQPSNVRAGAHSALLTLLRVGFAEPPRSPGALVVSYTTVSPLPGGRTRRAVCFLWHFPAGLPGLPLATTLPCGVRTFLDGRNRRGRPADSSAPHESSPSRSPRADQPRRTGATGRPVAQGQWAVSLTSRTDAFPSG